MMNDEDAPIVSEHMLDERKMKEKRRARTFVEVRFQVIMCVVILFVGLAYDVAVFARWGRTLPGQI